MDLRSFSLIKSPAWWEKIIFTPKYLQILQNYVSVASFFSGDSVF